MLLKLCLSGIWSEEALWPEPGALDEGIEVDGREDVLLEMVEGSTGHVLRAEERLKGLCWDTSVLELAQHELVVSSQEGCQSCAGQIGSAGISGARARPMAQHRLTAAGVPRVLALERLSTHAREQVVNQDRGLARDGSCRL